MLTMSYAVADLGQIRDAIKQAIHAKGLTQREVATRLGIHQPSLAHFLAGRRGLPFETVEKLVELLNIQLKPPKK